MLAQIALRSLGNWPCKIMMEAWIFPVIISSYLLSYLTIERTIAVCLPLFAKRFITNRVALVVQSVAIGGMLAIHLPMILMLDNLTSVASGPKLCTITDANAAYDFYIWYACATLFTAHPIIMLTCSAAISARLLAYSRTRGRLTADAAQEARSSSKELQASITVVSLALLQCIVYFPSAVGCMFYCLAYSNALVRVLQPAYFAEIVVVYKFAHFLFTIAHVWNFYVYFAKVPSFRRVFLRSMPFGVCDHVAGSTTASISNFTSRAKEADHSMSDRD